VFWVKQLINGLTQGSIYALLAIGYSLIFGKLLLVTFAYGEIVIFGVFIIYFFHIYIGLNIFLSLILSLPIVWFLGILVDKICYEKFRKQPRFLMLITTIGFGIFLKSFTQLVFSTRSLSFPDLVEGFILVGDIKIRYIQLLILLVTILLLAGLMTFFKETKFGLGIIALSDDLDAANLVGINVDRSIKFGHSLGCVLGVLGGVLLVSYYNVISANMGPMLGLKAFTVVVFGGISSMPGAIVAGYILGVLENISVATFGSGFRDIVAFAILIFVLILKPSGLLGKDIDLF